MFIKCISISNYSSSFSSLNKQTINRLHLLSTVPKEQRARTVFQQRGRRIHATHAMLRRRLETGMPRSGDLEEIYEEIRQDDSQGADRLRGYRQEGIPGAFEGGKNSE